MKAFLLTLMAAGLLLTGCGKSDSKPHSQATNAPATNKAEVAQPSGGYLGSLMQADKYAVKTIDVSYLNQAIQMFQTQEGRLPKDLNELVPNYVAKLPAVPYGSKIVYDPASGVVNVVKQ
jgi:major membrane immunogen (membrane-anchored lipoprotein)